MRSRPEWRAVTSTEGSTVRRAAPEGKWTTGSQQLGGCAEITSDTRQDSTRPDKNSPRQKHRVLAEDQKRAGRMAAKHNNLTK